MKVWLVSVGDRPASSIRLPGRLGRMDLLARALCSRGANVTWWSTAFDHKAREMSAPNGHRYTTEQGVEIILTKARGYGRNISVDRLLFNRSTAAEFKRRAPGEPVPDLILTSYPTIELVSAIGEFGRQHGIATVADVRDLWPDIWLEAAPRSLRLPATLLLGSYFRASRTGLRSMTAVTGITEEFVTWGIRRAARPAGPLDRAFPLGYQIPELPEHQIAEAERFWRELLGRDGREEPLRLCFIGAVGLRTGLRHVVEAVLAMPDHVRRKVQLVICGGDVGGELPALKALAARNPSVIFSDWVDQSKVVALMKASDLGVVPFPNSFDFQNSLSNKAIEYLAGGVPIITGLDGTLKTLIERNHCGYIYDNQSASSLAGLIGRILQERALLTQPKQAASALFKDRFRAESVYSAFADYIFEIGRFRTSAA